MQPYFIYSAIRLPIWFIIYIRHELYEIFLLINKLDCNNFVCFFWMNFKSQYSLLYLCVYTTVILYCLNKYIYAWHRIILCINHKSLWYNNKSWTIIKLRIRETSSWLYKDPCQLHMVTSFHRVWLFLDIIPLDETICSKQQLKRYSCPLSLSVGPFLCLVHYF